MKTKGEFSMYKRILLILVVVLLFSSFSSCTISNDLNDNSLQNTASQYSDDVMDSGPVKSGTINLFCTTPDSLNPLLTNKATVQDITKLIFEGLVRLDNDQKPIPDLCDKWSVSSDALIWTFHVRDNVYWQDKQQLTAEDVEFTIQTLMNPLVTSVYKPNIQNIATFAAIDRNTIRIFLKKPDSFTAEMMTFPIIPKHYYVGEDILKSKKNMIPVGTGPYKFISIDSKNLILSANEIWWNKDSEKIYNLQLPYISEINIKILENSNDAISLFQTRDVDLTPVATGDSGKYSGRSDLIIKKYPSKDFDFIALNMAKPAFKDKIVRQAIAFAIDRDKLISDCLSGDATISDLPVIPGIWLNDTNTNTYDFDLLKSKDMLNQDGWKEDNSGILYKYINGIWTQLNFNIMINENNIIRRNIAAKIAEQLKIIGIKVNVVNVKTTDEMSRINSKQYDLAILGVRTSSIPDFSYMYSTSEILTGNNIAGYSNPMVDTYLQQLRFTSDDNSKRAIFTNLKNIIEDEVPYIGLYFYDNAIICNKNIRGELIPNSWDIYNDITKWYIAKTK